jgi:hypothetical protein
MIPLLIGFTEKGVAVPLHPNHLDLEEREGAWALRGKMDRAYDVFEVLSDGMSIWKATIDDKEEAIRKLDELAAGKSVEFRLIHRPTLAIIDTRNGPKS